jgi:uncharacterized protein (DUF58 family)
MSDDALRYLSAGEQAGSRFVLMTPRRSPLGAGGANLSNRPGASLEFRDHREYQPGDDLRRIDWGAFARTDKLTIKLYQEEVSPHLDLLIDGSRSMALEGTAKLEATLGLAAVFAAAAANAGFTHTAWFASEGCRRVEGGSRSPREWHPEPFDYIGSVTESLARSRPQWRSRSIRVLISDLLWPDDPMVSIHHLCRDASTALVVQVLAATDVEPSLQGNVRLVDSETGNIRELFFDASGARRYREALERHQQNWDQACRQAGATMASLIAERVVSDWSLEELLEIGVLATA